MGGSRIGGTDRAGRRRSKYGRTDRRPSVEGRFSKSSPELGCFALAEPPWKFLSRTVGGRQSGVKEVSLLDKYSMSWRNVGIDRRATLRLLIVGSSATLLGFRRIFRTPTVVQIEGVLDPQSKVRAWRNVSVQIGREVRRNLAITNIRVRSGSLTGQELLDRILPYKPALRFTGEDEKIAQLAAFPPGTAVILRGALSTDRFVLLSQVDEDKGQDPGATSTPVPPE